MTMDNREQIFGAPWGRALKVVSVGAVLFVAVIAFAGRANIPVWILFPLLLLAVPFMVRGYTVTETELVIKRLGWKTRMPMDGFQSAEVFPNAVKGAVRLCGNGGLFSFTGLYRTGKLGNFRAFVNDLNRTVVVRFDQRTVVLSPDDPDGFVQAIKGINGQSNVTKR